MRFRDRSFLRLLIAACALLITAGCEPADQRPGLWLSGTLEPFPKDWSFTNGHHEIRIEVSTPYLLPHSVTIWCAEVDGALILAASNPTAKRWPGWVDADPEVTLKIADRLYSARLAPLDEPTAVARAMAAFQQKYELPSTSGGSARYWSVGPSTGG